MRLVVIVLVGMLTALAARADDVVVKREPFAAAHVQMMARNEPRGAPARLAEIELWAEGTRLRARIAANGAAPSELWVDGLSPSPILVRDGKVFEPLKRSLEAGLQLALGAAPDLRNLKSDRIAGHPCKLITEELPGGATLTRCIWRGLPLSIELTSKGVSFNAAAIMVEENQVTVADLQPPAGAPSAPGRTLRNALTNGDASESGGVRRICGSR